MRIVYLGFLKTGSRSICSYIKSLLKYKTYIGGSIHLTQDNIYIGSHFDLHKLNMKKAFFKGEVSNEIVYDVLKYNEDFISREFPYFGMYKYINENYENSKFILCIRNSEDVFNSYKTYMSESVNFIINDALFDVNGPITEENRDDFIKVYEDHNSKILEYFSDKPGKLLVLNFEDIGTDAFKKQIQDFLGKYDNSIVMKNLKSPSETI